MELNLIFVMQVGPQTSIQTIDGRWEKKAKAECEFLVTFVKFETTNLPPWAAK